MNTADTYECSQSRVSVDTKPVLRLAVKLACGVLLIGYFCTAMHVYAKDYQPMFDEALLNSLDPTTRVRFEKLETENRKRWENKNIVSNVKTEAARHHRETELALRRIEESKRLKRQLNAVKQEQTALVANYRKRCAQLEREITQLRAGGAIYELDDRGERIYLTEQDVKKRVKAREKRYKEGCTG